MPGTSVVDWAIFQLAYWSSFYTTTFGWGFRATGGHHVPRSGPVLLLANHQSHFDPVLVELASPRKLRFLARSTLFTNPVLRRVIHHFGAVPIDRGYGREGLHETLGLLNDGQAVLMFPEGERTHTGVIQPSKPGVSLLLKKASCPVVPVGIAGAFDAWPRQRSLPTPDPLMLPSEGRAISLAFGPPFEASHFHGRDRATMLAEIDAAIAVAHTEAERIRRKPGTSTSSCPASSGALGTRPPLFGPS